MQPYIEQRDEYWIAKDDLGLGNVLILRSSWSDSYLQLIKNHKIRIIRLNERLGWEDCDLSFLLTLRGIYGVDIISDKVVDLSPVFKLKGLRTLSIYCKAKIAGNFANLPNLKRISVAWRNTYESLFTLTNVTRINILGFPEDNLGHFALNNRLKDLRLESKRLSELAGIEKFPGMRCITLFKCPKLSSLNALGVLSLVEKVSMGRCPHVYDLSPLSKLSKLRELELDDCRTINSLQPLSQCKNLRSLKITGTTTIRDGDLTCLKKLPSLKYVFLVHRPHYSHTAEQLQHA